ncbi:MAG: sulfotransferase [Gammaproteobacteria bacterium]|nr:sulfotransferase [Gammaproteobacteria bacterium]
MFIMGCGHSGTSIILRILGAHSSFYTIEEESRLFYKHDRELIRTLFKWKFKLEQKKKKRALEKTPEHIYCLDRILKIFPKSKIIYMVRDGRDVACSHKHRNSFEFGVETWIDATETIMPFIHHKNIKILKLEEFVSNPRLKLTELLEFTGEKFENAMLEYYRQPAFYYSSSIDKPSSVEEGENHRAYRNWQINQPIFESTERWKNEMTEQDKKYFKMKAQNQLKFWDYESSDCW